MMDPAVEEWIKQVNTSSGGSHYGEADADWACQTLREEPELAAWTAVGDDRLIWAGRLLCTEFKDDVERAAFGFRGGEFIVGDGTGETVKPGRYISEPGVKDCYWERVNASGKTIANDFVSFAPKGVTLTVAKSDAGLKLDGCGPFTLAR